MQITLITKRVLGLACAATVAFAVVACAPEPGDEKPDSSDSAQTPPATEPTPSDESDAKDESLDKPEEKKPEARTQAASCEWDTPALSSPGVVSVDGQSGDLTDVIIGSWQHTHFDPGDGFEPLDHDIRYVFPSTDKMVYCQDVPGITDQAENHADITLDGLDIVLPEPAPGYTVISWNDSEMLWLNNFDNSKYLLQRR